MAGRCCRAAGRRPELSGIIHTCCGTNKQIGPRRPPDQRRIVSLILRRETVSSPSIPGHFRACAVQRRMSADARRPGAATIRRAAPHRKTPRDRPVTESRLLNPTLTGWPV
ncbi:hypothetical protein [Azospirillum largimobile]